MAAGNRRPAPSLEGGVGQADLPRALANSDHRPVEAAVGDRHHRARIGELHSDSKRSEKIRRSHSHLCGPEHLDRSGLGEAGLEPAALGPGESTLYPQSGVALTAELHRYQLQIAKGA